MRLQHLISELEIVNRNKEAGNIEIKGIADSSLDVQDDYVFVAIKGFQLDGHAYIEEAIYKGASVIIGEQDLSHVSKPYIQVKNSRKALGIIASSFYGHPTSQKIMIGITGTNGKTTTSYILKHILESNGYSCSLIGTIQNVVNGEVTPSMNSTPSPLQLQKLLATSNDSVVIMEVSSHGLTQYRVEGLEFDYCLFTNLNHDHLDYHGSMEAYFEAKVKLFEKLKENGMAVINTDDSWGKKLLVKLQSEGKRCYTIGQSNDNRLQLTHINAGDSLVVVKEADDSRFIQSPMIGIHNIYNTVMAYATANFFPINKNYITESINDFQGVNGRFEMTKLSNGATVVVDYAHTPDAIFHCLNTARYYGAKSITHVFGFRGDRDSGKRKEMLSIIAEKSDQYILTLDDLNSISMNEMEETLHYLHETYGNEKGKVILDRTLAIKHAIEHSESEQWIFLTGKGHEKYQQTYKLPTQSDKETIEYLTIAQNLVE
ncbi:UDP-N-acetylmuramoyl-L-alanyl-D-glutamate--2,6-diaminopimelate ligase [Aquibacillus sp. 3ASR75-11]|uniref:UDP-N-acetylmuramyl-tripeptide synthetase n=1 Tax=Terrihalobacillus insolitus TaxID=2950438 RepID=A0A9X3WVL4_9BACI|nr:UDP-N-acetylmuramoyl-L-alanyl-D-glutamate--2,6-diaminopimelate ligase [Terrihalobacillus insolitus]MDC3414803.1 UDP-N-acetylmuramoyl-L-alanyl-D-glutamate--2,6-diaminopimelate ligase [Terrihalobacillus insolitus]MDC3425638.1 UDP-N-acetylmuramoyl-L-alanyl-D-glutamate--2,6-diaminopimelate ligase [Terrihalobacillus insolitus]